MSSDPLIASTTSVTLLESLYHGVYQILFSIVKMGALALLSTGSLLYFFQGDLIYLSKYPAGSRENVAKPSDMQLPFYEDVTIVTPDKVKLTGYLIKRPTEIETKEKPTILFFQANAGNIGHRLPMCRILYERLECNIFLLSYRGYGLSEGKANEKGIRIDAQAGLDYVKSHPLLQHSKLVAFGESIGGAVAIDVVARNEDKFSGLIIENTFTSLPNLIPSVLPVLKYFTFLCHQVWPSYMRLPEIKNIPILFLSSLKDEIVPASHMKELFQMCQTKEKVWKEFPEGKHNDVIMQPGFFEAISSFWKNHISD